MSKLRRPKQESLGLKFWGGKRKGAGRPNLSGLRAHVRRPELDGKAPLHVTVKVNKDIPNLKRKGFFAIFREAVLSAREHGLRLNHYSIQSNHVHLILEASDNKDLERGMKSLSIRVALNVKKKLREFESKQPNQMRRPVRNPRARTGSTSLRVFKDRYHLHVLKTPTEVKRAIKYVLLNEQKHVGSQNFVPTPFSSVAVLQKWGNANGARSNFTPLPEVEEICSPPKTWLLRVGWLEGRN